MKFKTWKAEINIERYLYGNHVRKSIQYETDRENLETKKVLILSHSSSWHFPFFSSSARIRTNSQFSSHSATSLTVTMPYKWRTTSRDTTHRCILRGKRTKWARQVGTKEIETECRANANWQWECRGSVVENDKEITHQTKREVEVFGFIAETVEMSKRP